MKKQLAALMTVMLAMSAAWSGCSSNPSTSSETNTESTAAVDTNSPFAEHQSLSIAFWDSSSWGDDQFYQDFCEKFNVDIEFLNLDWGDYVQQLRLWAASSSMPDISACPLPSSDYFKFIDEGVIAPLPDDLSPYPNVEAFVTNDLIRMFTKNDKLYVIPRTHNREWGENTVPAFRFYIRKDWMEQAGYTEMPDSYEGFLEMNQKFVDMQLGGEGTVGFTATMDRIMYPFLFGMGEAPMSWKLVDGQWYPGMLLDSNTEWIKLIQKYYQSGAIDPDFPLFKETEDFDKFYAGKAGTVLQSKTALEWSQIKEKFTKTSGIDAEENLLMANCFFENQNGVFQVQNDPLLGTGTCFSSSITPGEMDRALRIMDWLFSDEGVRYTNSGLEGRDYTLDGDTMTSLLPIDENTNEPTPYRTLNPTATIGNLAYWQVDYLKYDPSVPLSSRNDILRTEEELKEKAVLAERNLEIEWTDIEEVRNWNTSNWYTDITKIIVDNLDVDQAFAEMKERMLKDGGEEAIQAVNARFPQS